VDAGVAHAGRPGRGEHRALRLQECARAITERHDGVVPRDEDALRALPGVGSYTAAAVVAFAHGGRSVVLDTNVRRVLARVVDGEALPAPSQTVGEVLRATALVPDAPERAAAWAAASMELGAVVCTARTPRCDACPVADLCRWRADGYPADLHAGRRRTQGWAGTDRQVRGRVMAVLRDAPAPVPLPVMEELAVAGTDRPRLHRCLDGLVVDGLVQVVGDDDEPAYRLPA
jgi:A/G-specific adenine glycosylase